MNLREIAHDEIVKGKTYTFTQPGTDNKIVGTARAIVLDGGTHPADNWVQVVNPEDYRDTAYNYGDTAYNYGVKSVYIYGLNTGGWIAQVDEPSAMELFNALPLFAIFRLGDSKSRRIKLDRFRYWIEGDTVPYLARLHLPGKRVTLWED